MKCNLNDRAITLLEQALNSESVQGDPERLAGICVNLGNAYMGRHTGNPVENNETALGYFAEALSHLEPDSDIRLRAQAVTNVAFFLVVSETGRISNEILNTLKFVIQETKSTGHVLHWARAQNVYGIALDIASQSSPHFSRQDVIAIYDELLSAITKESHPQEWALAHKNLGTAYVNREQSAPEDSAEQAFYSFERALEIFTPNTSLPDYFQIKLQMGRLYCRKEQWATADRLFTEALSSIENRLYSTIQGAMYPFIRGGWQWIIHLAPLAAIMVGDHSRALKTMELLRARSLRTSLSSDLARLKEQSEQILIGLYKESLPGSKVPAALNATARDSILQSTAQFKKALQPEKSSLKSSNVTEALDEFNVEEYLSALESWVFIPLVGETVSKAILIPPGSALQDIIISENIEFGFDDLIGVFAKQDNEWEEECDWGKTLRDLQRLGGITNADMAATWDVSFGYVAQQLWSIFGAWIALKVDIGTEYPRKKVTIIPQGMMSFFPFGTAHDDETGSMLLERFDLNYAPSLYTLSVAEAKRKAYQNGNDSIAFVSLIDTDLQSTPLEKVLITSHFPTNNQIALSGQNLNPERVLKELPQAGYWHFSTHGYFDLRNPHNSGISLSKSDHLSLSQLKDIDLKQPLRLVTLSACETGFHDILYEMDEFVGFPGSFLKLGAICVIATLWPVSDQAATLIMVRFYDFHIEDNEEPAAALRKAQLWLRDANVAELKEYLQRKSAGNHSVQQAATSLLDSLERMDLDNTPFDFPYYWAAFVLYGV